MRHEADEPQPHIDPGVYVFETEDVLMNFLAERGYRCVVIASWVHLFKMNEVMRRRAYTVLVNCVK